MRLRRPVYVLVLQYPQDLAGQAIVQSEEWPRKCIVVQHRRSIVAMRRETWSFGAWQSITLICFESCDVVDRSCSFLAHSRQERTVKERAVLTQPRLFLKALEQTSSCPSHQSTTDFGTSFHANQSVWNNLSPVNLSLEQLVSSTKQTLLETIAGNTL